MRNSQSTLPAAGGAARRAVRAAFSGATEGERSGAHFPPALRAVTAQRAVPTGVIQSLLLFFIQLYRWTFSPAQLFLFGGGSGCRFTPTCSQYAAEAVSHHGALAGSLLAFKRLCRCHPLGGCGHDPVPAPKDNS